MARAMNHAIFAGIGLVAAALGIAAGAEPAAANGNAGQVVAIWGGVDIERADAAAPAGPVVPGTIIAEGDRLTTGAGDRAKIVLAEHSVVDLAPDTEIVLRRQAADPATGRFDSLIEVVRGKVRARLEAAAVGTDTLYQVETPTAVVLRGTDFIVEHDAERGQTQVIGIRDEAEVIGRLAVAGGAVRVGAQEKTVVARGRFPVAVQPVPATEYSAFLQGMTIIGTGADDGLARNHPVATGWLVSPRDLPGETQAAAAGGLRVGAPGRFLADEMSNDVRVNDQPILEFERQQPGLPLPEDEGGVIVEF